MASTETSKRNWKRLALYVVFGICGLALAIGTICSTITFSAPPLDKGDQSIFPAVDPSVQRADTFRLTIWNLQQGLAPASACGADEQDISSLEAGEGFSINWNRIAGIVDSLRQREHIVLLQQAEPGIAEGYSRIGNGRTSLKRQRHPLSCMTGEAALHLGMGTFLPEGMQSDSASGFSLLSMGSWPFKLWKTPPIMEVQRLQRRLVLIHLDLPPVSDPETQGEMLAALRTRMELEYAAGNAVIVAGDWGMVPSNFRQEMFSMDGRTPEALTYLPIDAMPMDWNVLYDPMIATMRSLETPYSLHGSGSTTTDFFLISPNVQVLHVNAWDQQFNYSNHLPVTMEFTLR